MLRCKRRVAVILMILAFLLPGSAGCSEEPKKIVFGCALSLSGKLEETGRLYKQGYELWKEHVNSEGGVLFDNDRHPVDILYYDDESDPQKTASLVERLITEDKVDFLLGPYGSSGTFEAAKVAEQYCVPMVAGGGAAEKIFTSGFKYTFGLLGSASEYFEGILEYEFHCILKHAAILDPKPNKVGIVSASGTFPRGVAEGAAQHAESLGFDLVSTITFENVEELPSILDTLKGDEPNIVLLSGYFKDAISFVGVAKDVGLNAELFGIAVAPSDPDFVEQLGEDANYIFGTAQWVPDLPYHGPVLGSPQDYAQLFHDRFGEEPDYHAAAATACGVTYQLALEKASSLDGEKVRDALASLDVATFYGQIKFDEQGRDSYNPMVAFQIQEGRMVTVWPEELATGSAIYPTPPWEERGT